MSLSSLLAAAPVTVPTHPDGSRYSIQLFTVEGSGHGPYVALPLRSWWTEYCGHLFTRATAEQIVADLKDDACGMTGTFAEDGTLTFEWTEEYDAEGGRKVITPDVFGRYEIGDLWAWEEWQDTFEGELRPVAERLVAQGAEEYRQADRSPLLHPQAAAYYAMGRMEAHAVTLHLDDDPDHALNFALEQYGISTVPDDDCGDSWLAIPFDQVGDFDGSAPHLVAYVQADGESEVFVDEPVGDRTAHWHLIRREGQDDAVTELLTLPADDTAALAEKIADLLTAPERAGEGKEAPRIGHVTDVRDTRPAFSILYRRYQDTRPSFLRVQADSAEDAMAALTAHVGNTHYVVTSIRSE